MQLMALVWILGQKEKEKLYLFYEDTCENLNTDYIW